MVCRHKSSFNVTIGVVDTAHDSPDLMRMLTRSLGGNKPLTLLPPRDNTIVELRLYSIDDGADSMENMAEDAREVNGDGTAIVLVHFSVCNQASFLVAKLKAQLVRESHGIKVLLIGSIPEEATVEDLVYYDIMCSELSLPYQLIGSHRAESRLRRAVCTICDLDIESTNCQAEQRHAMRPIRRLQRWLRRTSTNSSEEM